MTAATHSTLSNAAVIAVNQDALGVQATLLPTQNAAPNPPAQLAWGGALAGGDRVLLVVNNREAAADLSLSPAQLRAADLASGTTWRAVNLWSGEPEANVVSNNTRTFAHVGPYDCVMLRLTPIGPILPLH